MSASPLDEIRRLKAELASAKRTIDRVGQGLNQLESDLSGRPAAQAPAPAAPVHPATPPMARPPMPTHPYPTAPGHLPPSLPRGPGQPSPRHSPPPFPPPPPSALVAWWQRESTITRVLGIAGALVTLTGLTLLLVLAVQQNWFTPTLRVTLGTVLSVALVIGAWVIHERGPTGRTNNGALALAATGHAGLYLVVLAITRLYQWVPLPAGLALAGLVAAVGIFASLRWQSQWMAIIQVVSIGLLALSLTDSPAWAGAFVVLVTVGLAPLHVRDWKLLGVVSILTATVVQLNASASNLGRPTDDVWLVTVVSALLLATGLGVATAEAHHRQASRAGVFMAICAGLPYLVISSAHDHGTNEALLGAVIVVGFILFVVVPRDRSRSDAFGWAVMVLATVALLRLVMALPVPDGYRAPALLGAAFLVTTLAGVLRAEPVAGSAAVISAVALLATVPMIELSLSRRQLQYEPWLPLLLTGLLAALWAAVALWTVRRLARTNSATRPSLVASVAVGLLGMMMTAVALGVGVGRQIDDPTVGFVSGHAIATIFWMLAAAFLLMRGLRRTENADLGIKLALGLAGVAVAKLFLYDLSALNGIWRGAAFLVVGLLLLGLGIGYAKALERAKTRQGAVPARTTSGELRDAGRPGR